jgi:hypothetical protein
VAPTACGFGAASSDRLLAPDLSKEELLLCRRLSPTRPSGRLIAPRASACRRGARRRVAVALGVGLSSPSPGSQPCARVARAPSPRARSVSVGSRTSASITFASIRGARGRTRFSLSAVSIGERVDSFTVSAPILRVSLRTADSSGTRSPSEIQQNRGQHLSCCLRGATSIDQARDC